MERHGLVVRQAMDKDARLKRIQLTDEAYANHKEIEKHMRMLDRRMLKGMSEEEAAELHRLLKLVLWNLEQYAAELSENPVVTEFPDDEEKLGI